MTLLLRFLLVCPALFLSLACTPPASPADQEGTVREAVARYDSVWMAKDSAAVEALLAPEYLYFSSKGELSHRAETIAFLGDTSYLLTKSHRTEVQVTISGDVARISSRWEGEGRYRGEVVKDDQSCGQTWVLGGGRWRLFTEHCVNRTP